MEDFRYNTNNLEFVEIITQAIQNLPTIGDQNPSRIIHLAHYSKNNQISSFAKNIAFSWTSRVSDDPKMIGKIIGYFDIDFSSIYLIKLGIGATYKPRNYSSSFTDEYAVDRVIQGSEFIRLNLIFNNATNHYVVT